MKKESYYSSMNIVVKKFLVALLNAILPPDIKAAVVVSSMILLYH
ncbi:hypothetical protein ykris0001_470 [Yersinia kristensenii ATCC 33638]|nr:hypothetical protein ykris0001_470 [Yersinia kristensenii ATCC 33638]